MTTVGIRRRGKPMPDGCVYVGRPSRFGNPFRLAKPFTPEQARECIGKYIDYLEAKMNAPDSFGEQIMGLKGKTLLCWCRSGTVHPDVIRANGFHGHAEVLALVVDGHSFAEIRAMMGEK